MSRNKIGLRGANEICADCGATDPPWASINRGILVCDECCSVHRSLGRHISQIKSLKKGLWSPTLLQMVHTLNTNGVNSIWEHSLLDPTNSKSGRRKPQPKDPTHPVKADFIRSKHQMLAFVLRPGKEDTMMVKNDLSKQLHASVRTSNLETSLRLLSQGADPNYFHEEKGTTALHVAAKAGQVSQVELLFVYGADPGALDNQGCTPIDYARLAGHRDLADRLGECVYELTDRLAYYLCSRRPDHMNGQHYIVPEMSDTLDSSELAKTAKKKLQMLPNHLFEELAMDVYDEVDRRETESVWQSMQPATALCVDRCPVPFLPVNPDFSSTRNQGRQKLARFNPREFATLIIDILSDAKRRQCPTTSSLIFPHDNKLLKGPFTTLSIANVIKRKSEISDDEPLYDSVASDDDYITTEQIAFLAQQTANKVQLEKSQELALKSLEQKPAGHPILRKSITYADETDTNSIVNGVLSSMEENLKRQLAISEAKMSAMSAEISTLQSTVQNLLHENRELRSMMQHAGISIPTLVPNGHEIKSEPLHETKAQQRSSSQRPASMYEPREGLPHRTNANVQQYAATTENIAKWDKIQAHKTDSSSEYDCPSSLIRPVNTQSMYHQSSSADSLSKPNITTMPLAEEVVRRTDHVTKRIQELWVSMQEPDHNNAFVPCAERIRAAVAELTAIFPPSPADEHIRAALRQLNGNTGRLQNECAGLQRIGGDAAQVAERAFFLQQVRSCAYDIAKATKQLVTKYQA